MSKKLFGIFVLLIFAVGLFGCGGGKGGQVTDKYGSVGFSIDLRNIGKQLKFAGPTISKVTATITASDFDPIVVNLTNDNGIWKGTATVRVGKNREIKIEVYDQDNIVIYKNCQQVIIEVKEGQNPVNISLCSVTGQVVINGEIENLIYQTDFSTDPGWTTNNSSKFYWDSTNGRYHYAITDATNEYTYKEVNYTGGSFKLEFDVLPTNTQWASDIRFGLGDSDNNAHNGSTIRIQWHFTDAGKCIYLATYDTSNTGKWSEGAGPSDFEDGIWYHNILEYNTSTNSANLKVTKVSDGTTVAERTITGLGTFSGMDRLFMSSIGDDGYPGCTSEGYIDNVKLYLIP